MLTTALSEKCENAENNRTYDPINAQFIATSSKLVVVVVVK